MTDESVTETTQAPKMDFSAVAIDAMVIQLDSAFQTAGDSMPEYVKQSGADFISSLNRWSDEKKKAEAAQS